MGPVRAYDAFVSYSHQDDALLGPALQAGLERFAKPWYRLRALRVFRDTASLAVNPALWAAIEEALGSARWLVVLASPGAASSVWVNREIEWWVAHRPVQRLLVVATSSGVAWDRQRQDWAGDAPVPPALRGVFAEEPLWLDLSDLRLRGRRPQIPPERMAALAAPLRGVPKDALIGEHLREHRRVMRLVRGSVAVLLALTMLALAASVIAVRQRDDARAQARIATARELAALAVSSVATHLDIAQQLAVAAFRMDDNPQTRGALLQVVAADPHLVRFLPAGGMVTAVAGSADGTAVVAGTAGGRLVWFDLATGQRTEVAAGPGGITGIAVSADGRVVAADDGTGVVRWQVGQARAVRVDSGRPVASVAVSPSGRLTAALEPGGSRSVLVSSDSRTGRIRRISIRNIYADIGFPCESVLSLAGFYGAAEQRSAVSLRLVSRSRGRPALFSRVFGTSGNCQFSGISDLGDARLRPSMLRAFISYGFRQQSPIRSLLTSSEIGPDGESVALVANGTVYIARPAAFQRAANVTQLAGASNITAVKYLGTSDDRLVSASGTNLELWDLRPSSRLGHAARISLSYDALEPPGVAFSPDGRWLAITSSTSTPSTTAQVFRYYNGSRFAQVARHDIRIVFPGVPLWQGNKLLVAGQNSAGQLVVTDGTGRTLASWNTSPDYAGVLTARLLPGRNQLAVVDDNGGVRICDISTHAMRQVSAGQALESFQADVSPDSNAVALAEGRPGPSFPTLLKVVYVDLRTRRSHVVGSGGVDAALFTSHHLLIQRSAGPLEIWNTFGNRRQQILPGSGVYVSSLAVSPDGRWLGRLRSDGTASITDFATGEVLATFKLPSPAHTTLNDQWTPSKLVFTPDGRDLLFANAGGTLTSWSTAPAYLIRAACFIAGSGLTASEWRQYTQTQPPAHLPCTNTTNS